MSNQLGFSTYLSNFEAQKEQLSSLYKEGSPVFTSFHISEDFDDTFIQRAEDMCRYLTNLKYKIIADVSKKTLKMFGVESLIGFAKIMNIAVLRIDYGFNDNEIAELAKQIPICLNASTLTVDAIHKIKQGGKDIYAMHNFYPRPETGLDEEQFRLRNQMLKEEGIKVLAFIPGDINRRGPIYEGLPSLEVHRKVAPYGSYLDLLLNYKVDGIFVGDGIISQYQLELIENYLQTNVISIPILFEGESEKLYDKEFTIRIDSPRWLLRLQESREYSCYGHEILPNNCIPRSVGMVTMDNLHYQRYSGEIQIIKESLPADDRVNVIGKMPKEYDILLNNIQNSTKIRFIKYN